MEKFLEYLQEAEKKIKTADHMIYVSFPLIKDKNLLLRSISHLKISVANCINSILQYEYLYKRINLFKDPKLNLQTFQEKCTPKYNITPQEIKIIKELFEVEKHYKKSPMEFIKNGKIVILSEDLTPKTITAERIKEFLFAAKNILQKTQKKIMN